MIDIDFVAGSHGNYLEFVLNKLTLGDAMEDTSPFNSIGASHKKTLAFNKKIFRCAHWFQRPGGCTADSVISVRFTDEDLLPLMSVSLLRAGDNNIDPHKLEVDTFNKLNNVHYRSLIDELNRNYSNLESYSMIKAELWPDVDSVSEFMQLPKYIQDECNNILEYPLFELSSEFPDCPRNILREFFKIGFNRPEINGLMVEQNRMRYKSSQKVFYFSFDSFYNTNKFLDSIEQVRQCFDLSFVEFDVATLHAEFLEKQIFKNSKKDTDFIVESIVNRRAGMCIGSLSVLQEAYINAQIEQVLGIELPLGHNQFPTTVQELLDKYEI